MYKDFKLIQIIDMACPSDQNINEKVWRNNRSISNWPLISGRGDQDTISISSQLPMDEWEKVLISCVSR